MTGPGGFLSAPNSGDIETEIKTDEAPADRRWAVLSVLRGGYCSSVAPGLQALWPLPPQVNCMTLAGASADLRCQTRGIAARPDKIITAAFHSGLHDRPHGGLYGSFCARTVRGPR